MMSWGSMTSPLTAPRMTSSTAVGPAIIDFVVRTALEGWTRTSATTTIPQCGPIQPLQRPGPLYLLIRTSAASNRATTPSTSSVESSRLLWQWQWPLKWRSTRHHGSLETENSTCPGKSSCLKGCQIDLKLYSPDQCGFQSWSCGPIALHILYVSLVRGPLFSGFWTYLLQYIAYFTERRF